MGLLTCGVQAVVGVGDFDDTGAPVGDGEFSAMERGEPIETGVVTSKVPSRARTAPASRRGHDRARASAISFSQSAPTRRRRDAGCRSRREGV